MSGMFSAEKYGEWRRASDCNCSMENKKASGICLIKTPISDMNTNLLPGLGKKIFHLTTVRDI
jgi:hypothetical protein